MNAAVCVLHRPGIPERDRNWAYARRCWNDYGFDPVTAAGTLGLYQARNQAADQAGDWDVAIFADSDIILGSSRQAHTAIEVAAETGEYVSCYDGFVYLDRQQTRVFTDGHTIHHPAVHHGLWVGCFAVRRDTWELLGGMDERFAGRKGQDVCFLHAAGTVAGKRRIPGLVYHLWHPRPAVEQEGAPDLWAAYKGATGDKFAMMRLLFEARRETVA